ncbi:MAG: ATP-dependent DNA helicase RecG [Mariniblastus sp.]|nr:ATP-dependent DNA helicase RecG [Mariniblastus sp.]
MSTNDDDRIKLTQAVQYVKGVGPQRAELLGKLGIKTAADLLFFFPRRYQDFTEQCNVVDLPSDEPVSIVGTVYDVALSNHGNRHVLNVLIEQPDGALLRGVWFNQRYMANKFEAGQKVQFRGKAAERSGYWQITHPTVIWIDDAEPIPVGHWPVYSLTDGINQHQMRKIVASAVTDYADLVTESFPDTLRKAFQICDIQSAIHWIHQPCDLEQYEQARERLVFQELLILQLALAMRRHRVQARSVAPPLELSPKIRARILSRLPFELSESQQQVFADISADMNRPFPMNRLLHGEVGSGKTMVAICAMMLSVAAGHQAALMAPTEILAQQHFQTLSRLLKNSRVRLALCTGSQKAAERRMTNEQVADGQIDIVIGTTAIVQSSLQFKQLGLVVIDEQHKFGVRQRARLKQSGFDPHYLVMTATPIPRSISMTLFGDLDVSVLERHQSAVSHTNTYLGTEESREKWWQFFTEKLQQGRQGFVVAPLVRGSDDTDVNSAEKLYESLVHGPLESFRVGLIHGQQTALEKQSTMEQFATGKLQVLVATGVIEVGIDVPNATVMTIESAERFGLSQLHQLRGRVGRGQHPGFVCVFATSQDPTEIERLTEFSEIDNGFDLSEADLRIRGPGNLFSTEQTGFPPLMIANLIRDEDVLRQTQELARGMIAEDPDLADPALSRLRQLVLLRYGQALEISDVG